MSNQIVQDSWIVLDPKDPSTYPSDGQLVTYYFEPFGQEYNGEFSYRPESETRKQGGTFCSDYGFCDEYDVSKWKPR